MNKILSRFNGVKKMGNDKWQALCPAHDDKNPSLSITLKHDKLLLHCHAGCELNAILSSANLTMGDLFMNDKPSKAKHTTSKHAQHRNTQGCSKKAYGKAKQIPPPFLKTLGLANSSFNGTPTMVIPYYDEDETLISTRYRTALDGPDKFRWKTGSKVIPYGLWKLQDAKDAGYLVLVEGESDCHTLWYKSFPAIGIPGAATWKDEWGSRYLADLPTIYAVIEPDTGGEHLLAKLEKSALRDRIKVVDLGEHQDPSGLFLAAPKKFTARFKKALEAATPLTQEQRPIDMASIEHIAGNKNILKLFVQDLASHGFVGEKENTKLVYLCVTTRLFEDPVSVVIKGASSGGKSYTTEQVLKFFPPDSYYVFTSLSPKALIYSDISLKHRFLCIYEAAGLVNPTLRYIVRTLLSEGSIRHATTENSEGKFTGRIIEKIGPTGLILTTTLKFIGEDQENRLLSVTINQSPQQTRRILSGLAKGPQQEPDFSAWHAFQEWLTQSDHRVDIPYAEALAELIDPTVLRIRRDFAKVLNLIRAHALLHQLNRNRDSEGNIIAKLTDYNRVYHLIKDPLQLAHETAVSQKIRETVEAVRGASEEADFQGISVTDLGKLLGLDKSNASLRASEAQDKGFLRNLEDKPGKPASYVPANPLPSSVEILPSPQELKAYWKKKKSGKGDR